MLFALAFRLLILHRPKSSHHPPVSAIFGRQLPPGQPGHSISPPGSPSRPTSSDSIDLTVVPSGVYPSLYIFPDSKKSKLTDAYDIQEKLRLPNRKRFG